MMAPRPVASRSPDRTGVCGARRGTLSQREKVTGRAFDRQIASTKREDRYAGCRIRTGSAFDRHICYATGDRERSSGDSRIRIISYPPLTLANGDFVAVAWADGITREGRHISQPEAESRSQRVARATDSCASSAIRRRTRPHPPRGDRRTVGPCQRVA